MATNQPSSVPVESQKVFDARQRRAEALAKAFMEWRVLADQAKYPISLHDIAYRALKREYELGRKAARNTR